jgi:hypothetical protein
VSEATFDSGRRGALLALALTLAALAPASAQQEEPVLEPTATRAAASAEPAEPRVVGMRVYPGAQGIASLTLDHPELRERVAELQARWGRGVTITRLEAGIYRLPGNVSQALVMAFYERELGRELQARQGAPGERASKQSARPAPEEAHVSRLPGGQGYLSITVGPDPLRPRDTRVVVVRAEGSPETRALLGQLTAVVSAVHMALPAAGAPAGPSLVPRTGSGALPSGPGQLALPLFPSSSQEVETRLNAAQAQALVQNVARSSYSPRVRQGIAGLLRTANAVTLSVYRVPRVVPGASVVEFYRRAMSALGAKETLAETADASRPLLVYTLPSGESIVMIRAYPEPTPLTAFTRAPLPSPISTTISVLRIDGASTRAPAP